MESVSGVHEFFLQTGEANGAEKVMQSKYTANSGREIESEQEGRGDRRGRVSNTKSLFAHTLYARVSIFIALPIVCSASFSRFSKIRQHLAATRLRYSELFKRPGPISINAVRTIPDLSTVYGQSSSLLCARQKKPTPEQTVEFGTIRPTTRYDPRRTVSYRVGLRLFGLCMFSLDRG